MMLVTALPLLVFCSVIDLMSLLATAYPFEVKNITVPSAPADPFLLQFHHTRYSGKCFEAMAHNYSYNTIVPFIQNFDLLVTTCNMVWNNPFATRTSGSCAYILKGRNTTKHTMERVHVQTDNRHHIYFVDVVLPYYVKRHKETGAGIILHTGGNDAPTRPEMIDIFLKTPCIFRWVPEQSTSAELVNHPKVMFLPTGICAREDVGRQGVDLRVAIAESVPSDDHTKGAINQSDSATKRKVLMNVFNSDPVTPTTRAIESPVDVRLTPHEHHRLLLETVKKAKSWDERLDRVLLCFGEKGNKHRVRFMNYARSGNCSVCDFCNSSLPALELWRMYGHYKFVLSPWGNGADCGRSWEIMLMGAVPVIEYFTGALGYERGGLATVLVTRPEELTSHNIHLWKKKHSIGPVAERLSMEYWRDRIFNEKEI